MPAEATQFFLVSLPYLKAPLLQPTQGLELRDLRSLGILPAHFGNDLICALPGGAAPLNDTQQPVSNVSHF